MPPYFGTTYFDPTYFDTATDVKAVVAGTPFADTTNTASYSTASWTPTNGRLYLVAVYNTDALNTILPTLSGNSQTWTQVITKQHTALTDRVTVFRCVAAGATAGSLTADFAGDNQTGCIIQISEWINFDPSGTNGSGAIVQTASNEWASSSACSVTLGAFNGDRNATYGVFSVGNQIPTVGSGFRELSQSSYATPGSHVMTEWKNGNDTTVDCITTNNTGVGVAIEIKALPVATTVTPATLALTTATFAPTVTATANQFATPTTAALALTTFAPTVTASNHQTVTPSTAALALTTFAPTVTATSTTTPSGGGASKGGGRPSQMQFLEPIPEPVVDEDWITVI